MTTPQAAADAEAKRLMLERLVAAPDAWRGRASAAGGFLGAAAAVSFVGLSSNSDRLDGAATVAAGVASVCYVLAVISFLSASVWPPPAAESETTNDFFGSTRAYVKSEARPIRNLVIGGAVAAAAAVIGTATCGFMLIGDPEGRAARVSVPESDLRGSLARLCPGLPDPFEAFITEASGDVVRVEVQGLKCRGSEGFTFVLKKDAYVALEGTKQK